MSWQNPIARWAGPPSFEGRRASRVHAGAGVLSLFEVERAPKSACVARCCLRLKKLAEDTPLSKIDWKLERRVSAPLPPKSSNAPRSKLEHRGAAAKIIELGPPAAAGTRGAPAERRTSNAPGAVAHRPHTQPFPPKQKVFFFFVSLGPIQ